MGQWLKDNVARNQAGLGNSDEDYRGIRRTNCHTQLSQELWRTEDCNDLIHGDCLVNPRAAGPNLSDVAAAVGLTEQQAINYLDPKNPMVQPPGVPQVTVDRTHAAGDPLFDDANVATIEVAELPGRPDNCAPLTPVFNAAFNVNVCVSLDADGDPSVNIPIFCTTDDCVAQINDQQTEPSRVAGVTRRRVPSTVYRASPVPGPLARRRPSRQRTMPATIGWPRVSHTARIAMFALQEQSGNINPFPPFNYPAKASLNPLLVRSSRHQLPGLPRVDPRPLSGGAGDLPHYDLRPGGGAERDGSAPMAR